MKLKLRRWLCTLRLIFCLLEAMYICVTRLLANPSCSTACGQMSPLHVDGCLVQQCVAFHNTSCGWMAACQSWEHLHSLIWLCRGVPTTMRCVPPHVARWLPTNPGNISTATPGCAGESLWCCAISQGTLPSLGPCPVDLHPGCGPRSIGLCTSSALHFTASLADCWV